MKEEKKQTGRPKGGRNHLRTPEEKETLIKEWQASGQGVNAFAASKGIAHYQFYKWTVQYEKYGLLGLKNKTGGNHFSALTRSKNLSEVDRLKLEILRKEIEIERLKKGYMVRGSGKNKEYVLLDMGKRKSRRG